MCESVAGGGGLFGWGGKGNRGGGSSTYVPAMVVGALSQ